LRAFFIKKGTITMAQAQKGKLKLLFLLLILLSFFSLFLTACDRVHFTENDARTTYGLADVTSAQGMVGRYSESYPTASVWYDNKEPEKIIICYHNRDQLNFTDRPRECHRWGVPVQVKNYPGLEFLVVNEGVGQQTQTVWGYFPAGSGNMKMTICDHNNDWLSGEIATATGCSPFPVPQQLDKNSVLVSLNSGQNIAAQSFWLNQDGTISVCTHDKNATGFLGLGDLAFGPAKNVVRWIFPLVCSPKVPLTPD
jgi:hypothetical protein